MLYGIQWHIGQHRTFPEKAKYPSSISFKGRVILNLSILTPSPKGTNEITIQ